MKVTRRLAGGVLAAGMLLSVALPTMPVQVQAAPAAGMQLYVAPGGSDSAAGTIDAPLQTLEGARDKIRAIKAESGLPEGGITVNLREGDYNYLLEKPAYQITVHQENGRTIATYPLEPSTFEEGTDITKFSYNARPSTETASFTVDATTEEGIYLTVDCILNDSNVPLNARSSPSTTSV